MELFNSLILMLMSLAFSLQSSTALACRSCFLPVLDLQQSCVKKVQNSPEAEKNPEIVELDANLPAGKHHQCLKLRHAEGEDHVAQLVKLVVGGHLRL